MKDTIKIKLSVKIDFHSSKRMYFVESMRGALTFRSADNKQDFGPGDWITERDAQLLAEINRYDITVVPLLNN
jgi:hypothetical protein